MLEMENLKILQDLIRTDLLGGNGYNFQSSHKIITSKFIQKANELIKLKSISC